MHINKRINVNSNNSNEYNEYRTGYFFTIKTEGFIETEFKFMVYYRRHIKNKIKVLMFYLFSSLVLISSII